MPADVDRSFRELVEQDYLTTEVNYFRTIFCASLAKLDFTDSFPHADYSQLVAALPRDAPSGADARDPRDGARGNGRRRCVDAAVPPPQPPRAGSARAALGRRSLVCRAARCRLSRVGRGGPAAGVRSGAPASVGGRALAQAPQLRAKARSPAAVRLAARGDARPVDAALLPHPSSLARDRADAAGSATTSFS